MDVWRVSIDLELDDGLIDAVFHAAVDLAESFTSNFSASWGPAPDDARFPHELGDDAA